MWEQVLLVVFVEHRLVHLRRGKASDWDFERRPAMKTMKVVSAIALTIGLAAAVPAFAQTPDPATNAVAGGTSGAATGAVIGCIVTIPIGCAPGAAVGAAVGGGVGATAGAASTPAAYPPPPPAYVAPPPPGYYH
jgi:hypothetical protein